MFENVKALLDEGERLGTPAMQLIIHHGGKEVFNECRGVSDENGTPLTEKTLFNIYSCTKFFTCVAALKLYEEGKFSLEDDLADYISAFGDMTVKKNGGIFKAEKRIKIKHLFTMTSGLDYRIRKSPIIMKAIAEGGDCETVKMMDAIAKKPLEFEPGEAWFYGLSHDVLGALIEIISGKRFGLYLKDLIFKPLGMNDTTLLLPDEKLPLVCEQYVYDHSAKVYKNLGKEIDGYKFGPLYESGGAGAISTASDYMKFLDAVKERKIISDETIRLMTRNHITEAQSKTYWGAASYGYGLGVRVPIGDGNRTDYGWGGAAGAFAAIDEVNDITLYYSQHVCSSPFAQSKKDFIEAAKLDLGFSAFTSDMWNGGGHKLA